MYNYKQYTFVNYKRKSVEYDFSPMKTASFDTASQ